MKLLVDMNLSPSWVGALTNAGIEAIHWVDVGNPADPDVVLFEWALSNGFIVFTNDLDLEQSWPPQTPQVQV